MKKSKFGDAQIFTILKQGEGGLPVAAVCCEQGMSSATYYSWQSKYGD